MKKYNLEHNLKTNNRKHWFMNFFLMTLAVMIFIVLIIVIVDNNFGNDNIAKLLVYAILSIIIFIGLESLIYAVFRNRAYLKLRTKLAEIEIGKTNDEVADETDSNKNENTKTN